ncbi:MAG TPA: PRC-barrel domain-containing protein [Steroidobacteraceae bacterium]|nr:PRC-barrel domain-containing protein [Steroidobacteraceae bacterium]
MYFDWIAAAATIIAALITAANLGARVTGWGFVMYVAASAIWIATGIENGFEPLSVIVMHAVLFVINSFGVWRWLGRQRRYEDSREHAHKRSKWARVPTLFSAGSLIGATVTRRDKESLGTVVDAMFNCDEKSIAYLVISEGGIAGAGETLRRVPWTGLHFDGNGLSTTLLPSQFRALQIVPRDKWPGR